MEGDVRFVITGSGRPAPITEDVTRCARCGGNHPAVEFTVLERQVAILGATHWAPCPTNGQPILLREGQH